MGKRKGATEMGASFGIPPLHAGARVDRREFERRYDAMPHLKKAELIEGVVYIQRSVKFESHGRPHAELVAWLGVYSWRTPGVTAADNCSMRLDDENEPQPDALLMIDPARGGQDRISEDDILESAPEVIAEVAASSTSVELHSKLHVYRRCGVKEYIVWRVLDRAIDWFVLSGQIYQPQSPDADGFLKSRVFPGLWLDVPAMLRSDLARVLAVLQAGTASPEHSEFVQQLANSA